MCLLFFRRSGEETSRPIKVEIVDVEKVKGLSKYYVSKWNKFYAYCGVKIMIKYKSTPVIAHI